MFYFKYIHQEIERTYVCVCVCMYVFDTIHKLWDFCFVITMYSPP